MKLTFDHVPTEYILWPRTLVPFDLFYPWVRLFDRLAPDDLSSLFNLQSLLDLPVGRIRLGAQAFLPPRGK